MMVMDDAPLRYAHNVGVDTPYVMVLARRFPSVLWFAFEHAVMPSV